MSSVKFKPDPAAGSNEKSMGSAVINMPGAGAGISHDPSQAQDSALKRPQMSGVSLDMPEADIPKNLQDDFNWDEISDDGEGDEDKKDEGHKAPTGFWRLHPLLRAFCIMFGGGIVLIIPVVAVIASHPHLPFRGDIGVSEKDYQYKYNLQCVARSFALLSAMWVFGTLAYHLLDMVPDGVLKIVRMFKGKRNTEKIKDRLQFFIAVKLYIKMVVISSITLVCFVIMFPNASYRLNGKVSNGESSWDQVLFQVNVLILFACAIIGAEKLILKVIATRFHKSAYKERLAQQTYASWVLDHLNRARELHPSNSSNSTPYMGQAAQFGSDLGYGGSNTALSGDPMSSRKELLSSAASHSEGLGAAAVPPPLNKKSRSSTGNSGWFGTFNSSNSGGENSGRHKKKGSKSFASRLWNIKDRALEGGIDMNSTQYATRLARKLFGALNNDRDYLVVDDFLPFFEKEEEAIKAFEFFDKDGNGDISKREMRDRVILIYKERRALLNALSDMSQVVGKLDLFMTGFALLVVLIVALMVFGLDALKSLATMGTLFIGWSFVFGNTFKTIFECIIFLFQVHSYDVGDTVVVNGENLTVNKIRLLSTVFYKTDGTYTVYPNAQLATMKIQNMRRSKAQSESIVVAFDFGTPAEKLHELRDRMNEYAEEHPRDMTSPVGFSIDLLENTNRVQISVGINYKSNWQDGGKRASIKNQFSFALRQAIIDLGLRYSLPLQPVSMVPPPPNYADIESNPGSPSGNRSSKQSDNDDDDDDDDDIFSGKYSSHRHHHHARSGHVTGHGDGGHHGGGGADGGVNQTAAMTTVMYANATEF